MKISSMKTIALVCLLIAPLVSSALPISNTVDFVYQGKCYDSVFTNCGAIGLSNGDDVYGMISFVDGDENRVVEAGEIVAWDFIFGDALFDSSSHRLSGGLVLNSDGTGFGGAFAEGLFFTPIPNSLGTIYAGVTGSIFFGALDGWVVKACRGRFCGKASGGGSYTKVSEPGTLMLFGIGLLAAGTVRRRRSTSSR